MRPTKQDSKPLLRRPWILGTGVLAVLLALHLIPAIAQMLLVLFGGILVAVFITGVSSWVARRLHIKYGFALALSAVFMVLAMAGLGVLTGARLAEQFDGLSDRIEEGLSSVRSTLEQHRWTRQLLPGSQDSGGGAAMVGRELLGRVGGIFSSTFGAIANVLILLVVAIYLSVSPAFYTENCLRLVPPDRRQRAGEVLDALTRALRWWFVGRFAAMTVVGVLTWIGLLIAGVPMSFALGFIAGLFSFVPFIGPIVSAIPGILVAWVQSPTTAVYALVVYVSVQILESNLITPLIERRAVSVPPALLISAQLAMGVLFGFWGILWATPLLVLLLVVIQMYYVQGVLNEDALVLGESPKEPSSGG